MIAQGRGWRLFNIIAAPEWVAVLVSIVVLNLVIYLQHVMFRAVPALCRHGSPDRAARS
ncbi:hypothetical protein [Loktanella sp. M215]|uniref:hypothetical protein n=1 Tax=Loktanella sp. M215 TaxID=2675431 RepID=UPI001F16B148|nr:hypothetical protein [Loktanella sp. M215]MCF7698343.1 hypothetical protein [Loktanella sp. M215]